MKILIEVDFQRNDNGEPVEWDGTAQDAVGHIEDTLTYGLTGEENGPIVEGVKFVKVMMPFDSGAV